MSTRPGTKTGRLISACLVGLTISVSPLLAPTKALRGDDGEEEEAAQPFSAFIKLTTWDKARGLGVFRTPDKNWFVVAVGEKTPIRIDRPVSAGDKPFLSQHAKEVYLLARRRFIQTSNSVTVGKIEDRTILAAGYGMEPLPEGERRVPGIDAKLSWLRGKETDWKGGVTSVEFAPFVLELSSRDLVLFGVQGARSHIKRGKRLHVTGEFAGTHPITKKGRLVDEGEGSPKGEVLEVPLITASRVVLLHKAFLAVYPHCFDEERLSPAKKD